MTKRGKTMIFMDCPGVQIHFSGTVVCPGLCILMNTYQILVNNALDFTLLHITYDLISKENYEYDSVLSYQGQVYLKQYLLLQ
jgi:hypothetical protein